MTGDRFLTTPPAGLISARPFDWAPVAELADAHGSGPCSERSGGSTPLGRTIFAIPEQQPRPMVAPEPSGCGPLAVFVKIRRRGRAEPHGEGGYHGRLGDDAADLGA